MTQEADQWQAGLDGPAQSRRRSIVASLLAQPYRLVNEAFVHLYNSFWDVGIPYVVMGMRDDQNLGYFWHGKLPSLRQSQAAGP
jgi:hypothetical protein